MKKYLRKKLIKKTSVDESGPYYYFVDDYCDELEENENNLEVIENFFNSLNEQEQQTFLKELNLDSADFEEMLYNLINTKTSFDDKIKPELEEIYVYNSNETEDDVQNCACFYPTYEAAEEAAENYEDDY